MTKQDTLPSLEQERAAFEAWAKRRCFDLTILEDEEADEYKELETESAWEAWQARAALAAQAPQPPDASVAAEPGPVRADLIAALAFYANGGHFAKADDDAWDTVSGEPQNYWCDEAGTATVEDGALARLTLAGTMTAAHFEALNIDDEREPQPDEPAAQAPQQSPQKSQGVATLACNVDCLGLSLALEDRLKTVESQTTERAMRAAANGLRLLAAAPQAAPAPHAVREPLSPEQMDEIFCCTFGLIDSRLVGKQIDFVRAIERAHGITKDNT